MKYTKLVLRILLAILAIIIIIPFKGLGLAICNVWNSEEEFKFPYAETIFCWVLIINHVIAILTVNKDCYKITDADRTYEKANRKEDDSEKEEKEEKEE